MLRTRSAVTWLLIAAIGSLPLCAQRATGSIAGSITDSTQASLPGARIVVTNLDTGVERSSSANQEGFYTLTALPAGRYRLSVTHNGFSAFTLPELVLQVDQNATVNAELKPGGV